MSTTTIPQFVGHPETDIQGICDQYKVVADVTKPLGYDPDHDTVQLQTPGQSSRLVEEGAHVAVTMSSQTPAAVVPKEFVPTVSQYFPHGYEPVMATLMIRAKVPMKLDLVVTPNVSYTISTLKEHKISATQPPKLTREIEGSAGGHSTPE